MGEELIFHLTKFLHTGHDHPPEPLMRRVVNRGNWRFIVLKLLICN
jgi:hypothetical protein